MVGAIEHFKGFIIGKVARRIGAIWQELYRGKYFEGGRLLTTAISASILRYTILKERLLACLFMNC